MAIIYLCFQVHLARPCLPGCERWQFRVLLLYSHYFRFLFCLNLSLYAWLWRQGSQTFTSNVVYIFVVNKRGLHLITISMKHSAIVIFILRAACLNCLQPFIAALCLFQSLFSSKGAWPWTWMFRLCKYENKTIHNILMLPYFSPVNCLNETLDVFYLKPLFNIVLTAIK